MLSELTCLSLGTLLRAVAVGLCIPDLVADISELLIIHPGITLLLDLLLLGKWSQARQAFEGDLLALESPYHWLGTVLQKEDGSSLGLYTCHY